MTIGRKRLLLNWLSGSLPSRSQFATVVGQMLALCGAPILTTEPFQNLFLWLGAGSIEQTVFVSQSFFWILTAALLLIVIYGEGRDLASVGLVLPRKKSLLGGVAIGVGVYVLLAAIALTLWKFLPPQNFNAAQTIVSWPAWLQTYLAITAGVTEEIIYRGYAQERLGRMLGRPRLAAFICVLAFALAHATFWGWERIWPALLAGGLFSTLYLKRRDLNLCISAHIAIDIIGLVILPTLAKAYGAG